VYNVYNPMLLNVAVVVMCGDVLVVNLIN